MLNLISRRPALPACWLIALYSSLLFFNANRSKLISSTIASWVGISSLFVELRFRPNRLPFGEQLSHHEAARRCRRELRKNHRRSPCPDWDTLK